MWTSAQRGASGPSPCIPAPSSQQPPSLPGHQAWVQVQLPGSRFIFHSDLLFQNPDRGAPWKLRHHWPSPHSFPHAWLLGCVMALLLGVLEAPLSAPQDQGWHSLTWTGLYRSSVAIQHGLVHKTLGAQSPQPVTLSGTHEKYFDFF